MTVVNVATGEIVEPLSATEADDLTQRIAQELTTLARSYESVMPLIREAMERRAWEALGYASPGAYVSERFGGTLHRLGGDTRRAVVGELTAAGMSTRAIAPVVGVSPRQAAYDAARVQECTPEPLAPVVGLDGKAYTRPDHTRLASLAVKEFPDLAFYHDTATSQSDLEHVWRMADKLREYAERGELDKRLDILRRSVEIDKAHAAGTPAPPPPAAVTCPACGQTVKEQQ